MQGYNYDDELVYLMRCGSEEAQDILYKRYYRRVSKWVLAFTKYFINGYEYEDFIQMAMMGFHDILDSYRDDQKASLSTFMKIAITKRILSLMRVNKDVCYRAGMTILSLDSYTSEDEDTRYIDLVADIHERYQPEVHLIVKETATYYALQIDAKTSQREKMVMNYKKAGYDELEIAKKLHISVKSVYNAVYRYSKKIVAIDELK